ncbi:16S rRNA (uracil(1498)-N(3))-methyltransferase [Microbacterium marmarense]|uniref:Ribosomal RNA small subunit methyltransferase E n=1 Tax=Microbacterium marmarense TaxID=3122051 RepID=A0ABU8LWC2_9MICO
MALHFLVDDPLPAGVGETVTLTGPEAHHAAAVRRVRAGEEVTVGDGRGGWLRGTVISVAPKEVCIAVEERQQFAEPHPRVILVQALAKGDRDELAVQAATELGIDAIVPWQSARSVSRWDAAKKAKGRARWASIVREAAKQAHRAWVPEVSDVVTTAALVARAQSSRVVLLEPTATQRLSTFEVKDDPRDLLLVVGPEGGISPDEITALIGAGADLVRLGETVLRTSTAGPAALAVLSARLDRW